MKRAEQNPSLAKAFAAKPACHFLAVLAGTTIICVFLAPAARNPVRAQQDYSAQRAAYAAKVSKTYEFPWGKSHPFWPTNAEIVGGTFIQPGTFPTAEYCSHCHEATYHQWRESAHANSFREPFYIKNVNILMNSQGIAEARHCEGCHNPIALFSGAMTPGSTIKRPFDKDGVTCMTCHSIAKLQPNYGTGSYVMGIPAVMVDAKGNPIPGEVSYAAILAHPERHKAAVMKDFYKTPQFCGTCHKAALPDIITHYKWLAAFSTYDEWQTSSYSKQNPLPFYTKPYTTCQNCHMAEESSTWHDYSAINGKVASHRWTAGNTAIPFYYDYPDQLHKVEAFLKAQRLNVDLFALKKTSDEKLIAPWGSTAFTISPGDIVETRVVIQNKLIGHSLIPEQRDFYQAWVEFKVTDATGKVIDHSGYLNPDGTLDSHAHSFTNRMIDKNGNYLERHEVWARRIVAYDHTIQSGQSTVVRYQFRVPVNVKGPLTVTARVNYRHFRQTYLNFVLGNKHPAYPVVEMAQCTRILQIGRNMPQKPLPGQNPDWMRWNNYGIALFTQKQYAAAVHAFDQVTKLRPDYADAYTNIGLVEIPWEKYGSAHVALDKALKLDPGNARALYYLALVERTEGHLDSAITDLRSVVQRFPDSPDARRELGYSYYQERKYAQAEEQYRALQKIDPNDLAAHYELAIIYRRMGNKKAASREAALFSDEKIDPMANAYADKYLDRHPAIAAESAPWHLHSDLTQLPVNTSNAN